MPTIKTAKGISWHIEVLGTGTPLLFIHGWGVDHCIWRQQIKHFSQSYRVLSVDLPGHGKTSWQDLSLPEIAEDLLSVLKELSGYPCVVVGSSLGGLLALQMADKDPDAIRGMIMTGSQACFVRSSEHPYGLNMEQMQKLTRQVKTDYPSIVNIFFRSLFTKQERATRRYKWIQRFRREETKPNREALLSFLAVLGQADLRSVLESMKIPLQFINGTEDYICPKVLFEELQSRLPQARFDWMQESGHFPFLIYPYEFNRMMEKFLVDRL